MTRILLVDDETAILNVLKDFFSTEGYDVTDISDSAQAAGILDSKDRFDIMISDIRMDPISGMELLEISRKLRPKMPVILITGYGSRETFNQARELGAFDCIAKPFMPVVLLTAVEKALKGNK